MGYPDTFDEFCVDSAKTWNHFRRCELTPKPFGDKDVDIRVECCGVCDSDIHTFDRWMGRF